MDEFLSPRAAALFPLGDRRCTATNRAGQRCGRAAAPFQFVCDKHGAKAPLAQKAAKERMALLLEPAMEVLFRATRNAEPCPHCGRSDADRDPVAVRAAMAILDRCGFGPTAKLSLEQNAVQVVITLPENGRERKLAAAPDAELVDDAVYVEDLAGAVPEGNQPNGEPEPRLLEKPVDGEQRRD
jgi:hypothetical protein